MGHSRIRIKVRRRKVAALASYSRQFTVKNTKENISPVVEHKRIGGDIPKDKLITNPLTGNQFVMTNPHTISGNYGVTITGYDWIPVDEYKASHGKLWAIPEGGFKQPKSLRKKYKKKYYCKGSKEIRKVVEHPSDYTQFKNYPYTLPKMNRIQYCEKLVEHKLKKWEHKNPAPADMFTEDVEKWKQLRETMKERFRDFVVSIYDPLPLTGRFVIAKEGSAKYTEEKVAEIKDINGDGHRVNEVTKDSKLIQKAQKITNETKAKRSNLIATNLKDHKRQKGRIILPEAA